MIRGALLGASRILFGLACIAALVAFLLGYAAWRTLRVVVNGRPPLQKREAGFAVLLAVVQFARTLQLQAPPLPPDTPPLPTMEVGP